MTNGELKLFALQASRPFGVRLAARLGISLAEQEERRFEDGEHKSRPLSSVRGCDVYVVHSLHGDRQQSANDKLCRLLFFIGALKDAAAARVTALIPYLCYARKDRKTKPRDPVTTRYVAALFEAVGTDCVVTLDVHNIAAFQNAFRCRTEHLEARSLFLEHFTPRLAGRRVAVVSPDVGGVKRVTPLAQALARSLAAPVGTAFMEKSRSEGVVSGEALVGEVGGCDCLILDDLISSGSTIARAVSRCRAAGAASVRVAVTHGLFVGKADHVIADSALDELVITDSVPPWRLPAALVEQKLTVLDCTRLFEQVVRALHTGETLAG